MQDQAQTMFKIEACTCIHNGSDIYKHNKGRYCRWIWRPKAVRQDWCPNPNCSHSIKGNKFEPYDSLRKWHKCKYGMWFKTKEVLDAQRD